MYYILCTPRIIKARLNEYSSSGFYNADQFGPFRKMPLFTTIGLARLRGRKRQKNVAIFLAWTNADGLNRFSPYAIGRAHQPRCFGGLTLASIASHQRHGWLEMSSLQWHVEFGVCIARTLNRKTILLIDNASWHVIQDNDPFWILQKSFSFLPELHHAFNPWILE